MTQQALDDAVETIRKRTDALGVSEPEIQRSGRDQISIGLPDVQNADRAIQQVGTTAQLQFYDWEANVLGGARTTCSAGTKALYDATEFASTQEGKAEQQRRSRRARTRRPRRPTRRTTRRATSYYLFGPDRLPIGPDKKPVRTGRLRRRRRPAESYLRTTSRGPARRPSSPKDTECKSELEALGSGGPPAGSRVIKVPEGVVVVEGERVENQPPQIKRFFVLEDDSELSGTDIKNPEQTFDPNTNAPIVTMEFTDEGREAFARVTKRLAERGARIIVPPGSDRDAGLPALRDHARQQDRLARDDRLRSNCPRASTAERARRSRASGRSRRRRTSPRACASARFPIELKLISQTQVSATLGQQALDQGLTAAAVGLALTIIFLLIFYRVLGLVATVALLIYAIFLFALVKLIPITLTLPGIAGLVLTLAVAADANIVMYERIKEEVRTGRSIPSAIAAGYSKALRTIIDANVVTIGVAFILFTLATAGVKGFAFTLGVGTLVSLFTAVLATSAILGTLARTRLLRRPSALGVNPKEKKGWRFDFMGKSRWFFSFSGVILAVGAIAIATLGLNFGIDFESGTRMMTPLEQSATVDDVRQTLEPLGYGDAKIQEVDDPELGDNVVQISVAQLDPAEVPQVEQALDADFGVAGDEFSATSVGPTFGEQIARTAVLAVFASLLLISLYIGFRFEFKFAVPVLIALAHDLLITAGVYALFDREVTTSTVAALLTIMGYSLYDTVIVFDRIRENVPRMPRATFSQIANRSMSEVFTRSLATSFVVLMPVGALLLFGGETLKDFAFALLVGVASGAYSSIFIATPVLVEWKEREQTYMRRRRLILREHGGQVPAFATGAIGEPAPAGAGARRRHRGVRGGPGDRRAAAGSARGAGRPSLKRARRRPSAPRRKRSCRLRAGARRSPRRRADDRPPTPTRPSADEPTPAPAAAEAPAEPTPAPPPAATRARSRPRSTAATARRPRAGPSRA